MLPFDIVLLVFIFTSAYVTGGTFLRLVFVHNVAHLRFAPMFNLVFGVGVTMFALILCELLHLIASGIRMRAMRAALVALVVLVVCVLPYALLTSLLCDAMALKPRTACILAALGTGCIYFVSYRIPLDTSLEDGTQLSLTLFESVFCRAATIGVTVVALLSGYAAVATPIANLTPFFMRRSSAQDDIRLLKKRQEYTMNLWGAKRKALALALSRAQRGADGSPKRTGFFAWVKSAVTGGEAEVSLLTTEVAGYEQVSLSLFLQVQEACMKERVASSGKTTRGLLLAVYGILLSLYCIGKVVNTIVNILLSRRNMIDPATRVLMLLARTSPDSSEVFAARIAEVSFALNAMMIVSSVRGFLVTIFRLTTQFGAGIGANTVMLAFSLMIGLYFTAMVLLIRLSLPQQSRGELTEVLGQLPFQIYHRWFDIIFVLSTLSTAYINKVMESPPVEK